MTCRALSMRAGVGPSGFEVRQEPCGGTITLSVGVLRDKIAPMVKVTASCDRCAAPEAPWLVALRSDPQWVLGLALNGWLDEHGQDFEAVPF